MNIEFLKKCDELYYNGDEPLVTDVEYDKIKSELKKQFPNDPYFQTVGSTPTGSVVNLPYILGSLNKPHPDGSLLKWSRENNITSVVVSDKLDGVSVYAKYVNGWLVQASTRGNGYEGRDITYKMINIQPSIEEKKGVVELRGEVVMTPETCKDLGYSLPRSAVSGILNGEEKKHMDLAKKLHVIWYHVLNGKNISTYEDHFKCISSMGLNSCNYSVFDVSDDIENILRSWYIERKLISVFDIDGLVMANMDDPSVGDEYYPNNIVAFKINEDAKYSSVLDVEWKITRSGKLQPIVHFTPINMNGSMVSKATGFNVKFIKDNNIHPGSEVGVVKSGDIIPYIIDCTTRFDGMISTIPGVCPSCGEILQYSITNVDLYCTNNSCPDQILYKIENFILSHGVEEITSTTLRKLRLTKIEDLYDLDFFDISTIDGFGTKKADTIIKEIKKTLNTTPENLLKSFGIPGVGKSISDVIINTFGSFDNLFDLNHQDFIKIDGIGSVLADNLVKGLSENRNLYDFMKKQGLKLKEKVSVNLQGKVFCLTGKSDINRNDLTKMIVSHGGMVKGISKSVDFLVTDDINSRSNKSKKAKEYGIDIITYNDLINMIGD